MFTVWPFSSIKNSLKRVFIWAFSCCLVSCTWPSSTTYVQGTLRDDLKPSDTMLLSLKSSCVSTVEIRSILTGTHYPELGTLRKKYKENDDRNRLISKIENLEPQRIAGRNRLICANKDGVASASDQWSDLKTRLMNDHSGLLTSGTSTDEKNSRQKFKAKIGNRDTISYSSEFPASLSLSARPFPVEQANAGVFAGMKERAQAALIDYGASYVKPNDVKDPIDAVGKMLKTLSPDQEAKVDDTHRTELTISSVLNSASINDRFDYLTAYVMVPPIPAQVNGQLSLEKIFLRKFQALTLGRNEAQRKDYEATDLNRALESIMVRVENADNINTEPITVALGSLSTSASLGLQAGQTVPTHYTLTGATPSLSQARTDIINKQLDKRSFWINEDRSLFRITQRGMEEVNIAGSILSVITLKIPKTNLYVVDFDVDRDADTKRIKQVKNLKLKNVEQPLYAEVNAVGEVLGTVRIAKTGWFSSYFMKEPSGIEYPVLSDPARLKLWNFGRSLWSLDLEELLPGAVTPNGDPFAFRSFGIYSTTPSMSQISLFEDQSKWGDFIEALHNRKIAFIKAKEGWYSIVSCPYYPSEEEILAKLKSNDGYTNLKGEDAKERYRDDYRKEQYKAANAAYGERIDRVENGEPGLGAIWLGYLDSHGIVQPLPPEIGGQFTIKKFDACALEKGPPAKEETINRSRNKKKAANPGN